MPGPSLSSVSWLAALALALLACGGEDRPLQAAVQEPVPAPAPAPRVLAIRPVGPAAGLEEALRAGAFFRWAVPRLEGVRVELGPQATGDVAVVIDLLPAEPATRELLAGLPVAAGADSIRLGGTDYLNPEHTLAVKVPGHGSWGRVPDLESGGAERRDPRTRERAHDPTTWVLLARSAEAAVPAFDDLLFRLAGRRGGAPDFDYRLRETSHLARSGSWARAGEGWAIDPARERDEIAARDRAFAGLREVRGDGVVLLVPPGEDPGYARLAAELSRAVREMAARVPAELGAPVTVAVEPDYVAQARHAGQIGEAVRGGKADLHLVYHPDDGHAYRHALAGVLLARSGRSEGLPPWLARGAALWLSEGWYGQSFRDWLPLFAAAGALPEPAELLSSGTQEDGSELLFTPAAAAVVDRLPGRTLAEKLATRPDPARVAATLAELKQPAPPAPAPLARPKAFLAGVSFAMLNSVEGGYHAPAATRQLAALKELGTNAVSLMPFASQGGPHEPRLAYLNGSPSSETDVGLLHAARSARGLGLTVLWKPHLWVSHQSWPGEVEMKSEEDWALWWRSYRRYVLHHAVLARWAKSELFCVGVELDKTSARPEWRDLIAGVRVLFPGPVTYASNWHGGLENVPFWGDLDYIGADAYYPLSPSPAASKADLARGAREVAARLEAVSRRHGKPVLLTEVGFAARRGAWVEPHAEGGDYSEEDQARAYAALFEAMGTKRGREPWLAGMFLWKAFSDVRSDSSHRADFRFMGRQAEGLVREYYSGR